MTLSVPARRRRARHDRALLGRRRPGRERGRPSRSDRRGAARGGGRAAPLDADLRRRSHAAAARTRWRACFASRSGCGCSSSRWSSSAWGRSPSSAWSDFFSGAVSAQQAIAALRIFNQERFVGATVGHLAGAGAGAGVHGAHDHRARRLGHGDRARLDAHHRADRRAHHLRRRSDSVPGHAADRGDGLDDADHDDGLQHRRPARRLPLFDLPRAHRSRAVHRAVHLLDRPEGLHHRRRPRRRSSA